MKKLNENFNMVLQADTKIMTKLLKAVADCPLISFTSENSL